MRPSIYVETARACLLVDPTPDFRTQALRAGIRRLDAVLVTHAHADHILGLDDLRTFCGKGRKLRVYGLENALAQIKSMFAYACTETPAWPGLPSFQLEPLPNTAVTETQTGSSSVWQANRRLGMVMTVLGTGTTAYAGFEYMQALRNYREYTGLRAEAQAGLMPPADVNAYYDENVAPHGNRFYVAAGVGGLLLASGVTLIVAF